ncbi:hypothetical protein KC960_04380 [Candidatus Saccharibacteria bacterium]|nr:hypothetical protein [Candidatus Saccharibacteria bacterium]
MNYLLLNSRLSQLKNCNPGSGNTENVNCNTTLPDVSASSDTLSKVLPILFGTITAIAVLIIVVQGIRFVLSKGEPDKALQARKGVIYAAVGLAVVFMADIIVAFILKRFL